MYKQITEETVYALDEWLQDNAKGEYNLDAWIEIANEALNNKATEESHAVIELKSFESMIGQTLFFLFSE